MENKKSMEKENFQRVMNVVMEMPGLVSKKARYIKKADITKSRIKIGGNIVEEAVSLVDVSEIVEDQGNETLDLKNYHAGDWPLIACLSSERNSNLYNSYFDRNHMPRLTRLVDTICLKESQKKRR